MFANLQAMPMTYLSFPREEVKDSRECEARSVTVQVAKGGEVELKMCILNNLKQTLHYRLNERFGALSNTFPKLFVSA